MRVWQTNMLISHPDHEVILPPFAATPPWMSGMMRKLFEGHERTFLDVEEDYTDSNSGKEALKSLPSIPNSLGDSTESWKALDFILALEWPCRNHIHHHAINPLPAQNGVESASEPSHNHALTATQTVYSCALSPPPSHAAGKTMRWHLPYSEIENSQ
ncbi:hypothetical protein BTJ68_14675 [Hortaea werneckii EXF-2000]|uniref:Uncharacterized protein n=1 Tax=Hortaea werneckii EXF-2000 TaxID=1157616 RepID=A0A1Z5SP59_HORWE|nr:hypothetical protein BTJ68_14675 [Hortaea werneckii EXF-2000]